MKPFAASQCTAQPPRLVDAPTQARGPASRQLHSVRNASDDFVHERRRQPDPAFREAGPAAKCVRPEPAPAPTAKASVADLMRALERRVELRDQPGGTRAVTHAAMDLLQAAGDARTAKRLLGHAQRTLQVAGLSLDRLHFNRVIMACRDEGDMVGAMEVLRGMGECESPVKPDIVTCNLLLGGFLARDDWNGVLEVDALMKKQDPPLEYSCYTYAELMRAHANAGRGAEAEALLDEMLALSGNKPGLTPDVGHWGLVIKAHARERSALDCHRVIIRMQLQDPVIHPDVIAYGAALSACEAEADWKTARALLEDAEAHPRVVLDAGAWHCLFRAHTKAGELEAAEALLQDMQQPQATFAPDFEIFAALIIGYREANRCSDARRIIDDAIRAGVFRPGAGYRADSNTIDFHRPAIDTHPPEQERGIDADLALEMLGWHQQQGHINRRTRLIVGHGTGVLRKRFLFALAEMKLPYEAQQNDPGVLVPIRAPLPLLATPDGRFRKDEPPRTS